MARQRILITGASSGLGEAMARRFAAMGRDLALCARRLERLEALRDELVDAHGVRVAVRALDVNDHDDVFAVVAELDEELGGLDRVVVNAGLGKGASPGTGYFHANRQTMETNLVAALAQCEAALTAFRERGAGHLVLISSMSAVRGMPRAMTAYSASKAGLSTLGQALRADLLDTGITVSTIEPGYIASELSQASKRTPLMVDLETGSRALVRAIEREPARACVPPWPWRALDVALRLAPTRVIARLG